MINNNKWLALLPVLGFAFMMLSLNGCAGRVQTEVIRPPLNVPEQMYQCENSTPRPKGETIMESDVAKYIAGLEFSNKDCKLRLKELSVIIKCYNDKDCNIEKLIEYVGLIREDKVR
jgi:hypothetical protein